jgi:hypothetical protein
MTISADIHIYCSFHHLLKIEDLIQYNTIILCGTCCTDESTAYKAEPSALHMKHDRMIIKYHFGDMRTNKDFGWREYFGGQNLCSFFKVKQVALLFRIWRWIKILPHTLATLTPNLAETSSFNICSNLLPTNHPNI